MERNTFLILATAAATQAVFAQSGTPAPSASSVTIFGVLDVAATQGSGSLTSIKRLSSSNWSSTRLGFRGGEDLGGGMRAIFWLEGALNLDDGLGGATNTNNTPSGAVAAGGMTWARAAFVGLVGAFGDVRFGRDFAPHHINYTLDPWATVGAAGSANHMGRATALSGWGAMSNTAGVRVSNQVEYRSPGGLGGFFVHGSHFFGESTLPDGNGDSLRVGYAGGPALVAAAWGRAKYTPSATLGTVTYNNIAGTYTFGDVKVMAIWNRDSFATLTPFKVTGWELGMTAKIGLQELRASYSTSQRENSNNALNPSIAKIGLGIGHNFSRNTNVYLNLASLKNKGGSAAGLNGSTTAANTTSRGADLGMRLIF
jgi:predicted porin